MTESVLIHKIKEVAKEIAPNYPNIEKCDPWEQLYAIESSYKGICLANDDLHALIEILRQKLNISKEELIKLSKEIK